MKNIVVVGSGTMGHSIATACAQAGYSVTVVDINEEILARAKSRIKWSLGKLAEKNKLAEPVDRVYERIAFSTNLGEASKNAELVIEAVSEDESLKRKIFQELDAQVQENCILATNTSSIPISEIKKGLVKSKNVIGLHFFNPPSLIKLVELIVLDDTDREVSRIARQFIESLGMQYINVGKDVPGFIVNRLNIRIFLQALKMVEQGYAPEKIDAVARYRLNLPMGLLELIDFIGLDVLERVILELRAHGFNIEESRILKEKVAEHKLGMKSGEGFYKYEKNYRRIEFSESDRYSVDPLLLLAPAINEAAWLISNSVAEAEVIDKGLKLGMNFPEGLLEFADEYGLDSVLKTLEKLEVKPEKMLEYMVSQNRLGMKRGSGFYSWHYNKIEYKTIIYEKRENHALITLNRPQKLNAITREMWTELKEAVMEADRDPAVKSILVTGAGKAFCTGDDISVMGSWQGRNEVSDFFDQAMAFTDQTLKTSKPLIALVNGYAYGGGLEITLLFDIVLMADNAKMSLTELSIGAIPPIAATYGVLRYKKDLNRYIFTAEVMPAKVALELGIAQEIVPASQLLEAGTETALKIAKMPITAIQSAKKLINMGKEKYHQDLRNGIDELIEISQSRDFKDGMARFLNKKDQK